MRRSTRFVSPLILAMAVTSPLLPRTSLAQVAVNPPGTTTPDPTAGGVPDTSGLGGGDGGGNSNRSSGWNTATNILAATSIAIQLVMPRVFYSDPDVTVGWKARWHVSVLAPVMTLSAIAFLNEVGLKPAFAGKRPGCSDDVAGVKQPGDCGQYGFLSTPSFIAGSSLGNGLGTFLVDTLRWSGGRLNVGGLLGEVVAPLIIAPITAVGRTEGNWETGGQSWGSAAIGLGVGVLTGLLYAELQRPECGYSGSLICW